jgi:RND family efflux transporter MFP subunit
MIQTINPQALTTHLLYRLEKTMSEQTSEQPIRTISPRKLGLVGIIIAIIFVLIVAFGLISRASSNTALKDWTEKQTIPSVNASLPVNAQGKSTLDLPGQLLPFNQAQIYARASGYLKNWKVDIGDHVTAGEVIAQIETPDLDAQLAQSKADVSNAQAAYSLAKNTATRLKLLPPDATSAQDLDAKSSAVISNLALLKSAQANVDRLQALQQFKNITAPFDGVVTARNTDIGAFINASGASGANTATGLPLFVISSINKLRVSVNVPQTEVSTVKLGTMATLTTPSLAGQSFVAKVSALSHAIDASTGTTLIQFIVDNPNGLLLPGGFVNASIAQQGSALLQIPSSALLFDKDGLRVATVGPHNRVLFKTVTIARDEGKIINIGSGLKNTDLVITNPPDGLVNGDTVSIEETPKTLKPNKQD